MNRTDVQRVMTAAHLGAVRRIRRFVIGHRNLTYRVATTKGEYCVRGYLHRSLKEFAFEMALLNTIRRLPVPHLHRIGSQWTFPVGRHFGVIYTYIPGRPLWTLSVSQCKEVGRFLGRFHLHSHGFSWHGQRSKFYDLPDKRIKRIVRLAQKQHVPYTNLLPEIVNELQQWKLNSRLPEGPIHVDVKPENILFEKGHLSGVIDFDNSYIGPLILDLATSMVWCALVRRRFDLKRAEAVYSGYRRERRLTPLEYRELYRTLRFKFVSHVFVDYEGYTYNAVSDEYLSWLVNVLYWAYRHLAISEKQFYRAMPR